MLDGQICPDAEIADLEAQNGLIQFDAIHSLFLRFGHHLKFDREIVCQFNRLALSGIYSWAGEFRKGSVNIRNTEHSPPDHFLVPLLIDEACQYANEHIQTPIHCAAYLMWRLNWIHPFFDGNGRTARSIAYLSLCVGYDLELPGTLTILDQISRQKTAYYAALDEADTAWNQKRLNVSAMEALISGFLRTQLETAV